jgi:hypothetical protein
MGANLIIDFDEDQKESLTAFLDGLRDRLNGPTARQQITPILLKHLEPLVEKEREILEPHNKSGALSASLTARAGSGDNSNTVSVFSAPTATNTILANTWGLRGRMQQKGWAANLRPTKTRKRVFYGAIVHQGHGNAEAIPFADEAAEALGDQAAESAAEDVLKLLMPEGDNG